MHASKSMTARKGMLKEDRHVDRVYRFRLYGCDKSQSHTTIQQPIADAVVRDWVVESIGLGEDSAPKFDHSRLNEIQTRLAALHDEESRGTDALIEGIGNAARIKGRSKAIESERQGLSGARDAILAGTCAQCGASRIPDRNRLSGWARAGR